LSRVCSRRCVDDEVHGEEWGAHGRRKVRKGSERRRRKKRGERGKRKLLHTRVKKKLDVERAKKKGMIGGD